MELLSMTPTPDILCAASLMDGRILDAGLTTPPATALVAAAEWLLTHTSGLRACPTEIELSAQLRPLYSKALGKTSEADAAAHNACVTYARALVVLERRDDMARAA